MKIAILGTKGIPNNYGGFEQFAECISVELIKKGYDVTVYSPHFHPYQEKTFKGVNIRHIYSPEDKIGASGNFVYDWLCMVDALKQGFDVIYEAGYHSNAPSYWLLKEDSPIVITNMDGIEWKRSKWNWATRKLIRCLEKLAVKKSDYLVSDNIGIQEYYKREFCKDSFFIPYGAEPVLEYFEESLIPYQVTAGDYYMLIARMEPENNIEMILDGYVKSNSKKPFLVVGKVNNKFGLYLTVKYRESKNVVFLGAIYNKKVLDDLRYYASAYFHGHSVGGTNPSLLEAMASKAHIVAHNNEFNKNVLQDNALYFSSIDECTEIFLQEDSNALQERMAFVEANFKKIIEEYSWKYIADQYDRLFKEVVGCQKRYDKKVRYEKD